jgi:hypothetical protein
VLFFLFAVIVISFSEKKIRFFACCGTVHYGSGTIQNRFFGGIRFSRLFPEGKRRSK